MDLALGIAILSLLISAAVAWDARFRPVRLVAAMPHMTVWSLSSWKGDRPTGEVASRHLVPALWIGNLGAREAFVDDLRLVFHTPTGAVVAYPQNRVPEEAVTSPSTFHDHELLRVGGPFVGFHLPGRAGWHSEYGFRMSSDGFASLQGDVTAVVEICKDGADEWQAVLSERFEFGSYPLHLQSLQFEGGATAGSRMNPVQSSRLKARRKDDEF